MQKVLVLEDSPTQAEALRCILEAEGFAVAVENNGRSGLARHMAEPFDVVVSDVLMPGMTGYDFCRAAKRDPHKREVPVVLLTTLSEPLDIVEGLQCGADNFITKPYEPAALVERLRAILSNRRWRRRGVTAPANVEMDFMGHRLSVAPENEQIFDLLRASFEQVARSNRELEAKRQELARARDLAERESRFKSRFLASMSHELRTPLNSIIGFSELMEQELPGPLNERQREYIDNVLSSGRHLLHLVNDILDISKIEAGKMQLNLEWTPLVPIVEAVTSGIAPLAQKQGLTLESDIPGHLPDLHVDRVRLKEVLFNLLSNAVKFTKEGGKVTVSARLQAPDDDGAEEIEIAVRDTGIGIDAEGIARLFREFEQIHSQNGDIKPQGTGLGLALCKKLVELHGGRMAVSSVPGQGSTFSAFFPHRPRPAETGEA